MLLQIRNYYEVVIAYLYSDKIFFCRPVVAESYAGPQDACSKFETFYLAKHTGRRISWQPSQGQPSEKVCV